MTETQTQRIERIRAECAAEAKLHTERRKEAEMILGHSKRVKHPVDERGE